MKLIDFSKNKKMKDLLSKMGTKPNKDYKFVPIKKEIKQMKCLLCGSDIDKEIIKDIEDWSGEKFIEGYCSTQCEETDKLIDMEYDE